MLAHWLCRAVEFGFGLGLDEAVFERVHCDFGFVVAGEENPVAMRREH